MKDNIVAEIVTILNATKDITVVTLSLLTTFNQVVITFFKFL